MKKMKHLVAALAAVVVAGGAAHGAAAQTYSAYPTLYNNLTTTGLSISVINVSGFYDPLDTTVPASSWTDGRLRTSGSFGVSQWVVHASVDAYPGEYCYFGFTMNNSDGAISGVAALKTGSSAFTCAKSQIGRSLFFEVNP